MESEVNHTNNINGRPVIVVSQSTTLGSGVAGLFTGSPTAPTIQLAPSMNVDTPVHEFGHLLGLNDIDPASGSTNGTHPVLMGYNRGTTASTLSSAIKYQDIQGIARVNGRHTTHQFSRFLMNGSRYIHFCFYCSTVDDRTSALSGSAAMETASNCTHTYQQMVSQGSRNWLKCTKCYKVMESDRIMVKGLTSTTLKVTGAIGTISGSFIIPSILDGQSVTEIGAFASDTTPSMMRMDALDIFNKVSLVSLYDLGSMINGTSDYIWKLGILLGIAIICFTVGIMVFKKKDLPL